MRILILGIQTLSAAIILIPILLIWKKVFSKNIKQYIYFTIFALYLSSLYSVVGLPSIGDFSFDLTINLIPIVTMIGDIKNSILNIILFLPVGIALPFLFDKFISVKRVTLFGLSMSLIIEFLQIFTYRTTDVNDLITNTLGTIIGYFIIKLFIDTSKVINQGINDRNLYMLIFTVFIVMFFIQPMVSSILWDMLPEFRM